MWKLCLLVLAAECCLAEVGFDESGKHLFVLSGQSNMRQPLPEAFQQSVEAVFGEDKVLVTTTAVPSQPIRAWYKQWTPPEGEVLPPKKANAQENGWLYERLLKALERKRKGQALASVTFVWMQGEADAGSGWASVYEQSFFGVLDQLKADLKVPSVNFVIGRINDHWLTGKGVKDGDAMRALQQAIGESHDNGDWVNTDDLNSGMNPWAIFECDGGHFPVPGYRVLGQRFARKACLLLEPGRTLPAAAFNTPFFDSVEDLAGHAALGKSVSGTLPAAGGEAALLRLVDGEYGTATDATKAWLTFAPRPDPVELTVDLGELKTVRGLGFNMLINKEAGITFPKGMQLLLSEDGVEFQPYHKKSYRFFYGGRQQAAWLKTAKPQSLLVCEEAREKPARFVRVVIEPGSTKLVIDELIVNPTAE